MTNMDRDEQLDAQIRTRVIELIEASPAPPRLPAGRMRRRRRLGLASHRSKVLALVLSSLAIAAGVAVSLQEQGTPAGASELIGIHAPVGGSVTGRLPGSDIVNGRVDWKKAPRLIEIVNGNGASLGYVLRADLDGTAKVIGPRNGGTYAPSCGSEGIDVFNATGTSKVGAYYPGAGFVREGDAPTCVSVTPTTVIKKKR